MSRYTVSDFVERTAQKDLNQGVFELENKHMLEVNLNGRVWTKTGSMVANMGNVKFVREGMMEHGLGRMLKQAVTGEGTQLTKAEGSGKVYLADSGKEVAILNLNNESICINGHDILAFEDSIKWDIKFTKKIAGMLSGGLFHVVLSGTGMIAFTTHYEPMTLKVTPSTPVLTDPNATVAWSSNLEPELKTDINLRTIIGRGSGEALQMVFRGEGFVVIQPYEEVYYSSTNG
jgi:uncharacterized protein (AIM24 family)